MTDYISRQAAIRAFNGCYNTRDCEEMRSYIHKVADIIKSIPTADVVEVVRCKDCRYWQNYNDVMVCGLTNAMMSISDYCSYGERADK